MVRTDVVHRLTRCFQALTRDDWRKNMVWHAKKGTPVLCGRDFDWFLRDGCGSPAVLATTRKDLGEFSDSFTRDNLPFHLRQVICGAFSCLCVPFGFEVYMDTLETATQEEVFEAMLAAVPTDEEPSKRSP